MTTWLNAPEALDAAVRAAETAQLAALMVEPQSCGVMYPFGTAGDALCPVTGCWQPVYMHLGYADQRKVRDEMEDHGHICRPGCPC